MDEETQIQEIQPDAPGLAGGVYDLIIAALTIVALMVMVAYLFLPVRAATKEALLYLDFMLSLAFLVDSFILLVRAPDKGAYLRWGWLDFAGSIPLVVPLRVFRLARLVRIWRVFRSRSPKQILAGFESDRAAGTLLIALFAVILGLCIASLAVLEFEGAVPGSNIESGQDAFWWAFVTVATVGYGDFYPITNGGRLMAILLMTIGIGLFGAISSYLAAKFLARRRSQPDGSQAVEKSLASLTGEVAAMKSELSAIRRLLEASEPRDD